MPGAIVLPFPIMNRETQPTPNRIREWRKKRGLTLRELGEDCGIAYGHLSRMELGNSALAYHWMERIAAALNVEVADLVNCDRGGLTESEREVINTLREVPEATRRAFMAQVAALQPYRGAGELITPEAAAG